MHQSGLVRTVQGRSNLLDDEHGATRLQRPRVQQGLQVHAVDQPHRDIEATVDLPDVVDRHDMGIVQPRGGAGFPAEARFEVGIFGEVWEQHFQRYHAVDSGVIGAPHFTHSAATQQFEQLVTTKRRALLRRPFHPNKIAISA